MAGRVPSIMAGHEHRCVAQHVPSCVHGVCLVVCLDAYNVRRIDVYLDMYLFVCLVVCGRLPSRVPGRVFG